jgi:N-acetylglucosamine repressor
MKAKMGNSDLIKRINIINIIEILKLQGMKSRAELANLTGLTPASITKLTKKLIDLNLLKESGIGNISGGRPPILLEINPDYGYIIGINLAPTKIKGILTDINGTVLFKTVSNLENKTKEYILESLFSSIENLKRAIDNKGVLGIGIAMNGMVDYEKGVSIFSPHYKWKKFNLRKTVEEKFNIPTIIENDVRAMALGEHKAGMAIHKDNFVVINVGEGIGAGIILNNKLYRGDSYTAGEIGHITVEKKSEHLCSCGNYGCLEALIGNKNIIKRAELEIQEVDKLKMRDICRLARDGNPPSLEIIDDIAENLGYSLSFLINLLNPKLIILVGEINSCGEFFYEKLKSKINQYSLKTSTTNLEILPSKLGYDAGTVGATILVYENLFEGRKILKI